MRTAYAGAFAAGTNDAEVAAFGGVAGENVDAGIVLEEGLKPVVEAHAGHAVVGRESLGPKFGGHGRHDRFIGAVDVEGRMVKPDERRGKGRDACGGQPGAAPNDDRSVRQSPTDEYHPTDG